MPAVLSLHYIFTAEEDGLFIWEVNLLHQHYHLLLDLQATATKTTTEYLLYPCIIEVIFEVAAQFGFTIFVQFRLGLLPRYLNKPFLTMFFLTRELVEKTVSLISV